MFMAGYVLVLFRSKMRCSKYCLLDRAVLQTTVLQCLAITCLSACAWLPWVGESHTMISLFAYFSRGHRTIVRTVVHRTKRIMCGQVH